MDNHWDGEIKKLQSDLAAAGERDGQRQGEIDRLQIELASSRERQNEQNAQIIRLKEESASDCERDDARQAVIKQLESELTAANDQSDERRTEIDRLKAELDELKACRQQQADADDKRAVEVEQLTARLAEVEEQSQSQHDAAQVALAQARADQEELREQLSQSRKQLNVRSEELGELRERTAELKARLSDGAGDDDNVELAAELTDLKAERDLLLDRLAEAELQLKNRPAASLNDDEIDDLRRRFEMAVEDVRELKGRNAELEEQRARARSAGTAGQETTTAAGLDWEAQKRKMMAQLEADFEEDDDEDREDRMTIEGTIRITDQVVADKEREITELKQQLEEADPAGDAADAGDVAVGAAAIAEMLDQDDLVKQERENLTRLQEQWHEKLRKAEIDISVERAKIARERAELKERLEVIESRPDNDPAHGEKSEKPSRGRWLSRLGLKDADDG